MRRSQGLDDIGLSRAVPPKKVFARPRVRDLHRSDGVFHKKSSSLRFQILIKTSIAGVKNAQLLLFASTKECFAFFDEARSRGADLKLAMTARAMVT